MVQTLYQYHATMFVPWTQRLVCARTTNLVQTQMIRRDILGTWVSCYKCWCSTIDSRVRTNMSWRLRTNNWKDVLSIVAGFANIRKCCNIWFSHICKCGTNICKCGTNICGLKFSRTHLVQPWKFNKVVTFIFKPLFIPGAGYAYACFLTLY